MKKTGQDQLELLPECIWVQKTNIGTVICIIEDALVSKIKPNFKNLKLWPNL